MSSLVGGQSRCDCPQKCCEVPCAGRCGCQCHAEEGRVRPAEHAKVCRWIKGQQVEYDTQACLRCRQMDAPTSGRVQAHTCGTENKRECPACPPVEGRVQSEADGYIAACEEGSAALRSSLYSGGRSRAWTQHLRRCGDCQDRQDRADAAMKATL